MRRGTLILLIAVVLCIWLAVGCGSSGSSRLPLVRVINASPDSPNLDVVDGFDGFTAGFDIARNLAFRSVSAYTSVNSGSQSVAVFASDSSGLLLQGTPFFGERQDYTIVLLGSVQFLNAILLTDDNSAPAANNFKLRFVHTSPTTNAVDVYITSPNADLASASPSFANIGFGQFAGYATQPQGAFQLRVTLTGTKTVLADTGSVMFTAGQIRTAVLVNPPGTATEPLNIVLVRDVL